MKTVKKENMLSDLPVFCEKLLKFSTELSTFLMRRQNNTNRIISLKIFFFQIISANIGQTCVHILLW